MLDQGSEEWRNRIERRKTDGLFKGMRWAVLIIFLINWYSWFVLISRHWGTLNDVAAVGLLTASPVPCVLMFFRREAYPPIAAFFTYCLLGVALGVAGNWRG